MDEIDNKLGIIVYSLNYVTKLDKFPIQEFKET